MMRTFIFLFSFLIFTNTAMAQCTNPAGAVGAIIYNSSEDAFQGCTDDGWEAFHNKPTSYTCPSSGLVSHWKLDDGTGSTTAADSVGTNDGDIGLMNPAQDWVYGKFGMALDFDGTDDFVTTATADIYDTYDTGTLSFWINISGDLPFAADMAILSYSATNTINSLFEWFVDNDYGVVVQGWKIDGGGGQWAYVGSSTDITDGVWHHVAFVADGASRTKIYLDGTEETTGYQEDHSAGEESDFIADTSGISSYNHNLYFGARVRTSNDDFFTGQLDDIRIYNRALTEEEVGELYGYGNGCL
jgi:hypothetical protein